MLGKKRDTGKIGVAIHCSSCCFLEPQTPPTCGNGVEEGLKDISEGRIDRLVTWVVGQQSETQVQRG